MPLFLGNWEGEGNREAKSEYVMQRNLLGCRIPVFIQISAAFYSLLKDGTRLFCAMLRLNLIKRYALCGSQFLGGHFSSAQCAGTP